MFMMIFLCRGLWSCSVELIDLFLCLSGSSFGSEILDGVSLREAEETELFFGTHGCLERNATIWGISGNGTEHSKCVTCT